MSDPRDLEPGDSVGPSGGQSASGGEPAGGSIGPADSGGTAASSVGAPLSDSTEASGDVVLEGHRYVPENELPDGPSVLDPPPPEDIERQELVDQISLTRRLRQPRTILSLIIPIVLLVLIYVSLPGFKLGELANDILQANGWLLLAAVVVYYIGFPLRGMRWSMLLRGAGSHVGTRDATELIYISWLVNCLVPAKLGDIYRAYLLKINAPVSLSRTFGTVFIERILDIFAIVVLGLAAGFVSFRGRLPPEVNLVFAVGVIVVIVLAFGLLTLRNFGRRLLTRLPVPPRVHELYDRFEEGVFGAVGIRQLPALCLITGLIWATEAGRLYFVVEALGFPDVHLGISGAFFVALTGSLLTAVPFTPAGLGVVEVGMAGLLTVVYGVPATQATAIVVVDRAISVLSVVIIGLVVYFVSPLRRGRGLRETRHPAAPQPELA